MSEPKGKLKVAKIKLKQKPGIAIYFDIILEDLETGKFYKHRTSSFMFNLEEVIESGNDETEVGKEEKLEEGDA